MKDCYSNHKKKIELCLRDSDQKIVAWCVGYSNEDIDELCKLRGWHRSHAEYTEEGLR